MMVEVELVNSNFFRQSCLGEASADTIFPAFFPLHIDQELDNGEVIPVISGGVGNDRLEIFSHDAEFQLFEILADGIDGYLHGDHRFLRTKASNSARFGSSSRI